MNVTSLVIDNEGKQVADYNKVHLVRCQRLSS